MKSLISTFLDSILYFFALGNNPIEEWRKRHQRQSDSDNMARDWYNIGQDIRNAFEKYKPC